MLYQYQMQRRKIGIKQRGIKNEGAILSTPAIVSISSIPPISSISSILSIYSTPYPLKNKRKNNEHQETNNSTCYGSSGNIM